MAHEILIAHNNFIFIFYSNQIEYSDCWPISIEFDLFSLRGPIKCVRSRVTLLRTDFNLQQNSGVAIKFRRFSWKWGEKKSCVSPNEWTAFSNSFFSPFSCETQNTTLMWMKWAQKMLELVVIFANLCAFYWPLNHSRIYKRAPIFSFPNFRRAVDTRCFSFSANN